MDKIKIEHIAYFRKILHIKPNDSVNKIDINFENKSISFHPSVRPIPKFISHFDNMVVAREFLKYMKEYKEMDEEQIIDNWNEYERDKVQKKLDLYKSMSRAEYEKAVEVNFMALNVLKIFLYIFLSISTIIGIYLIIYLFSSGSSILGIFILLFIIIVIIAFAFRRTGIKRRSLFRRKY